MGKVEDMRGLGPPGAARQLAGRRAERPTAARSTDNPLQVELVRENERLRARVAELEADVTALRAPVTPGNTVTAGNAPLSPAEKQRRYRSRKKAKP